MVGTHGFELIREQEIPELNTRARLFRHKKTGAELLSLENDDENKVFSINFRTPPADSTGAPHIMEHSVLCGSRKYPVKEPFVELIKGSLNTFLNAMTFPDKTCYPVASQNLQDFYNLIDVYLDAVFYPNITPYTLQQEGWHYELKQVSDPLLYKGVVFNEMKGAYSTPESVLDEKSQQLLFPDSPYRHDYGGDPGEIPELTYDQFKDFHQAYYHPSNALIFFYGDDDPEARLRILEEYLSEFEALKVDSTIPLQPSLEEARRFVLPYEAGDDPNGQKWLLTVNWLLPDTSSPEMVLGMTILAHILVGTPASPLRKALIESGLGEDLAGRGLETSTRQMFFSTGMKGIAQENVDHVEALIFDVLKELAQAGIDPNAIAASLNTVEFSLRENNTGSYPRGLVLMLRSLTTWLYDGDPLAPLAFENPLAAIKARLANGDDYFEEMIRTHMLENAHRTTVILEPDPDLGRRREAAERERLELARAGLSPVELEALVENTLELQRRQETPDSPEALATIPTLSLEDLDKQVKRIPLDVLQLGENKILYHDIFTNGILYLDVGFNLQALPQEWLPFTPLFGRALLEMGTATEDYVSLSQRIGRDTGGIWPTWLTSAIQGTEQGAAWMFLRGKATVPKAGDLLAILDDVLRTVNWDNRERFRQMALEAKASHETNLLPAGHIAINRRLRARFNAYDWAAEQMNGVENLFALRRLLEQIEADWPGVLRILEGMQQKLLKRENLLINATLDKDNWEKALPQVRDFVEGLPDGNTELRQWKRGALHNAEGLTIPSPVNYVGKGADLYTLGYQAHGSVLVIAPYLRNTWLWDKIRVQGGAYGAFCVFDRHSGVFTFISYRDPNLSETLQVYDRSGQFLQQLDLSQPELTKAIIAAIGDMDAYQLPDAQGYTSMQRYLTGVTDEERQRLRDQALAATPSDFRSFGEILERMAGSGSVVALGSPDSIQAARERVKEDGAAAMEITKVL